MLRYGMGRYVRHAYALHQGRVCGRSDDEKPMKKNHDIIEVECTLQHQTDAGLLVDFGGKTAVWVPKSLCEFGNGTLQIPEWLATEKGMV